MHLLTLWLLLVVWGSWSSCQVFLLIHNAKVKESSTAQIETQGVLVVTAPLYYHSGKLRGSLWWQPLFHLCSWTSLHNSLDFWWILNMNKWLESTRLATVMGLTIDPNCLSDTDNVILAGSSTESGCPWCSQWTCNSTLSHCKTWNVTKIQNICRVSVDFYEAGRAHCRPISL